MCALLLSACGGDPENPDVTAEQFAACRENNKYNDDCQGETTTLTAIVESHSSDGVRMSVRQSCGSSDELFTVDAENLDSKYFENNKGRCVRVFAEIGPENTIYPDITVNETVWTESAAEFELRQESARFIAGGWESREEFERAKAQGITDRATWIQWQAAKRAEALADAEWEQVQSWPEALSGFWVNVSLEQSCDNLIVADWSDLKRRITRRAFPTIYDPATRSRYFFIFNEELDQREDVVERLWPVWRSKKSPAHYLFYSPTNRFDLWEVQKDGTARGATLQRDGKPFGTDEQLAETVAIMNKVRPNIEPSEYHRYGIMPEQADGSEVRRCERQTYQTLEALPFPLREKGDLGRKYFTIEQVLGTP